MPGDPFVRLCRGCASDRSGKRCGARAALLRCLYVCALLTCPGAPAMAASAAELADLSLEQLANIVVTSVSRREERLADAPASIYVISSEDIRRSGATSIPEVLRLAPNVQVARADVNSYSISARGFNGGLANKLLVLLDGRILYSPLFSGVFWDAQDVLLEDVDRIEVISGPGAALWGANAVNGVINIITRPARETQGVLAFVGGGNRERGTGVRYGGKLGNEGHYRIYGKLFDRDAGRRVTGVSAFDASERGQVGFRADWGGASQSFTVQGDAYGGDIDQFGGGSRDLAGANLLARWERLLADGSTLRVKGYYDRVERDQPGSIREKLDNVHIEVHHAKRIGRHGLLWGGGYRYSHDQLDDIPGAASFRPGTRDLHSAHAFVHDEIELRKDLTLTLGVKVEHNDYTGAEILPNARLAWTAADGHLVWTALSRAVRAPARIDRELFTAGPPATALRGGPDFHSEVANVFELGYRAQPTPALSYSITAFYHDYNELRSIEPVAVGFQLQNRIYGRTRGLEGWTAYRVTKTWRVSAGGTILDQKIGLEPGSASVGGITTLGNDPKHGWVLRSAMDIAPQWELDVMVRNVGSLPSPAVPAYTAFDARLAWRPNRQTELSLTAQNLFDPDHVESGAPATRSEFRRGVFLKALWRQ